MAELAAIPSVSADPGRRADVARAARWLLGRLRAAGLADVRLVRTAGAPAVVAWADAGADRGTRPTVLVYGHYDVQPTGPVEGWRYPPFTPTREGDRLIGRGVSDNKGQLLIHVAAIESWLAVTGSVPVNVVVVLDGEEEVGSHHLRDVLDDVWSRWPPDAVVISDTRMRQAGAPALTVSLRGALHGRLTVRGAAADVHSGSYGGVVADPARELCRIITGLHDGRGRLWPTLRAAVRPSPGLHGPPDRELLALARARPPAPGAVEAGFTAYERGTVRPALVVSALQAGQADHRGRAVVVAQAQAQLTLRLAPGQDPDRVRRALAARIRSLARGGTHVEWTLRSATPPVRLPTAGPLVDAARAACRVGFGVDPVLLGSGGTVPAVHELYCRRGVPTVLLGFALPDDRMHAANEQLSVSAFERGIRTAATFLASCAAGPALSRTTVYSGHKVPVR